MGQLLQISVFNKTSLPNAVGSSEPPNSKSAVTICLFNCNYKNRIGTVFKKDGAKIVMRKLSKPTKT